MIIDYLYGRIGFLFLLVGFFSCLRVDQLPEVELEDSAPFLAFPLVSLQLQSDDLMAELGKKTDIRLNEEQVFAAFFRSDSFIQTKDDLFPKTTFGLPIPIVDSVVSLPVPGISGITLHKGVLKGDQLTFVFNSAETTDIALRVSIPQLIRDEDPFLGEFTIPYDGDVPSSVMTPALDLNGYTVDFSDNLLTLRYDARKPDGQRVVLPLSFARISAFDFSYLEGTITRTTLSASLQRIDIDIQDSLIEGSYRFENPKIHFDIANSFGIPIGVKVKEVYVIGDDAQPQPLISDLFDQTIILRYPGFDQQGELVTDRITFDRTNSNLLDVTRNDIVAIDYNLDVIINPEDLSGARFFILDTSKTVITAEIELGFDATIREASVEKLVDIDLTALDSVRYLRLKLTAENGIPLSFNPVLILRDTSSQEELTLSESVGNLIESAQTDETGNQVSPTQNVLYFEMDEERVVQARTMNQLSLRLTVQSPAGGDLPARIKPGQTIAVKIGAEAKLQ